MKLLSKFLRRRRRLPLSLEDRYPQYSVGRGSYGGLEVLTFGDQSTLKIGNYCSFALGVQVLLGGNHRPDWATTYPFSAIDPRFRHFTGHPQSKGDVVIGNDVWVAREAMILSGVTVGDGAVIGARAVVSRNVPPYTIVAGNPAVEIRTRFSKEIVERLLALRWWDWPEDRVAAAMPYLLSDRIETFLDAAEQGQI
jgi:acetyltransferase-like isoleucine patch superfamily enzyme